MKKTPPPIHASLISKKDDKCYDPEFKDEDKSELWSMYSDSFKDKNGVRPRGEYFTNMTVEQVWNEMYNGSLDDDEVEDLDEEKQKYGR